MFSFFRSKKSNSSQTVQQTLQETYIQEQQSFHGSRALSYVNDYQRERQAKLDLINERIVSNGIDQEEFLKILSKEKEFGVNVDFHTIDEIIAVIEKESSAQHDFSAMRLSGFDENRANGRSTVGNLFDGNINRESVGASFAKKNVAKRQTLKITGTIFNQNKNVVCSVSIPVSTNQDTSIAMANLQFDVSSFPFKWKVKRSPHDFLQLREYLLKMYPQTLIPSLPIFNTRKPKLTQRQLEKKCLYYQRFLNCMMKSQILRSDEFLVQFLKEEDAEQFHAKLVTAKYNKGPERIDDINTLFGDVDVNAGKRAKRFCRKFTKYIDTQSDITAFIKRKCKDLQRKSHELADEFYAVATEVQRFSTLLKTTEIPQITQLYDRLSQLILRNGDFVMQSGEIVNTQLNSWFKYHHDETKAYIDQKDLVEKSKRKYERMMNELLQKKNALFKKGDVKLWKVSDDLLQEAMLSKSDKNEAFKYMLPKETEELQSKKEEWEFFTGQCYKEIKRATMVNYDMGREVLVNTGEMMLRVIYQMNIGWQEFLSYYTGLNAERKLYDEKFLEERGILEEAEDLVVSSGEEEDPEGYVDDVLPGILVPDDEVYKENKQDWKISTDCEHPMQNDFKSEIVTYEKKDEQTNIFEDNFYLDSVERYNVKYKPPTQKQSNNVINSNPNVQSNNYSQGNNANINGGSGASGGLGQTPQKKTPQKSVLNSQLTTAVSHKDNKGQFNSQIVNENKESLRNQALKQNHQIYNLRSAQSGDRKKSLGIEKQTLRSRERLRERSEGVRGTKTLNLKSQYNQITRTPSKKIITNHDDKSYSSPQIRCRFATERINLPRGKVIRCSRSSSANGSKRNSQSPVKLPRNMPPLQEPNFQGKVDYYKEYWKLYFQNESLVADIEQTAHSNYKALKKIYNLEDYYEHNLIPQLLTYPHKFVHRLRQQQLQKQQQQQKLVLQQKQQQELLQQMKSREASQQQQALNNEQTNGNEQSSQGTSVNGPIITMSKDRMHKRKKHLRRTAAEIEREFICPYAECGKFYGSEGSLNLHIKIKHNGGNKTERERLAKTLVTAYVNGSINRELDSLDLNLPPGALQKAVKKAGLIQQVSENEILRQISSQIQNSVVTNTTLNPKSA